MKKLILALACLPLATFAFAQSLSIVGVGVAGDKSEEGIPAVDNTLEATYTFSGYMVNACTYYFYIQNNSSQSGTVQVIDVASSNEYAQTYTPTPNLCYKEQCYAPGSNYPDFEIEANGNYYGEPEMDLQLIYEIGSEVEGTGEYRLEFKFEHDEASSVFYVKINNVHASGIASAEVIGNIKVYQDNAGNIVADYGFGNSANRTLSIISIAGQKVFECPINYASGTMALPVNLSKGVYLYSVTENGKMLSTYKFIVK